MSGRLPRTRKQTDTDEKKKNELEGGWSQRGGPAAAAHTGCDPAAQTDAELPPNTSARTSDRHTRVIVCQDAVGGYRLIGKSGACQEICCRERPSAADSPSNHQSWLKKRKKKKTHTPTSVSSTRCQRGTSRRRRFLRRQRRRKRHF